MNTLLKNTYIYMANLSSKKLIIFCIRREVNPYLVIGFETVMELNMTSLAYNDVFRKCQ